MRFHKVLKPAPCKTRFMVDKDGRRVLIKRNCMDSKLCYVHGLTSSGSDERLFIIHCCPNPKDSSIKLTSAFSTVISTGEECPDTCPAKTHEFNDFIRNKYKTIKDLL